MKPQIPNELKVRVYGIIEHEGKILLSTELLSDFEFIKFPGDGLVFGETPAECLRRELREELNINNPKLNLHHVSEVYVQNRFNPNQQVIGIYYKVGINEIELKIINNELRLLKTQGKLDMLQRIWISKNDILSHLTFEMDLDAAKSI